MNLISTRNTRFKRKIDLHPRSIHANRCFEDSERAMPDIKLLFFRTLLDWFSVWRNHSFSLLDLLDFCNFRSWFVLPCILPVCLGVSFLLSMKSYYLSKKKKTKKERTKEQRERITRYGSPSPRPIKKKTRKESKQLVIRSIQVLKSPLIVFLPNTPHQTQQN